MSDQHGGMPQGPMPGEGRIPAQRRAPTAQWEPQSAASRFRPSAALVVALVAVAVGAVLELSFSTTKTVNGAVTDCSYFNLSPLLFGVIAVAAGVVAVRRSGQPGYNPQLERGVGALAVALGAVQVLGAFDLLGGFTLTLAGNGPC